MKISKVLVLVLLLISLLALTVASQISKEESKLLQATDKITLEENQDCEITFYNGTENIYGNVTRTRNVYGQCFNPANQSNYTCVIGTEQYQSYEVIDTQTVLKNKTGCKSKGNYVISINNKGIATKKEIDFSRWGACIHNVENNCLVVTCVSLHDGAHDGQFTDCRGGKSCQKFVICEDKVKAFYKNSGEDFVEEDPTFYLDKLQIKEVGR